MQLRVPFLLVLSLSGVAACSSNSYCLVKQDYQKAEVVPELKPVEGLAMPASPSALRLPDRPTNAVPFGVKNADGDGVCLDKPPQMAMPEKGKITEPKDEEPKAEAPKT